MTGTAGVHDTRDPAAVVAGFTGASAGREFIAGTQRAGDLRPKFEKLTAGWLAARGQVYVSFKPEVLDVTSGAWTPHLVQLGQWLAAHPGVKVIVWHEPEDNLTGAAFADMFLTCRNAIKQGSPGAVVAYCAMAYHWRPAGNAGKNPAPWTKVIADEYLVDVYSGKSFPETTILPEHAGFTTWYAQVVAPKIAGGKNVVWGVAERGFQAKDPQVRAAAIRREGQWLAGLPPVVEPGRAAVTVKPALYLYWNTGGTESNAGWVLDPAGESALRELIGAFTAVVPVPEPDRFREGYEAGYRSAWQEIANIAGGKLAGMNTPV